MPSVFFKAYRRINRVVKIGARMGVFAIALVAFLCAGIIGLTQLESFRTWAIGQGLTALNNELLGRVEVDDVSGNFLTGLTLRGVRVYADSTILLEAPTIDLTYQLRPIFDQQVVGARAIIHHPVVQLIRNARDGEWNFNRLTKPAVDSVVTPFNWDIEVQAFEIIDGRVIVNDRTAPPGIDTISRVVDYTHLELEEFNVALQARIAPTEQSVWLQNLAFNAPQPDVRVVQISTELTVDTTGVTMENLFIETGRSLIRASGRIDSVNFLGVQTAVRAWQDFPIRFSLDAPQVSTLELKRFIADDLDFLDGTPSLKVDAHGRFADLVVDDLRLGLSQSDLRVAGRLTNMNHPEILAIDGRVLPSRVSYADVMDLLPGLDLPDLRYLGRVDFRSASFKGPTDHFTATIDAGTAIGSARGGAWLDLRGARLAYTADLGFDHVDLAPLAGDRDLKSDFTGRVVTNGSGTSIDELAARVRVESQASKVAGRQYRMLYFDGTIGDGGVVTADTLLVAWGSGRSGSAPSTSPQPALEVLARTLENGRDGYVTSQLPLTATARSVFASNPTLAAGGWIDLRNIDAPKYDMDVRGRDVNLAAIVLDNAYVSDLTFVASVKGTGFEPDDIDGSGVIAMAPSSIGGESIPATDAKYTLKKLGAGQRSLVLESDIADATVTGVWSFETLVNSAARGVDALSDFVTRTSRYQPEPLVRTTTRIAQPIDARYELDLKDLSRLSGFIKGADLAATGKISGEITGNADALDISAVGTLDRLSYRAGSTDVRLGAATLDIELKGVTPYGITDATSAHINLSSDSLLHFGDMTFTIPSMMVNLSSGLIDVRGATVIDREISILVHGQIDASNPAGYLLRFDTVLVNLPQSMYSWRNIGTVEAVVADGYVRVDSMTVQRANAEVISVKGTLTGNWMDSVEVRLVSATLADIKSLLQSPDDMYGGRDISGKINEGVIKLNGTLENPNIQGHIGIDSVIYSGSRVGNFMFDVNYSDSNASGAIVLTEVKIGSDSMRLPARVDIGSLPIDLALAPRENRLIPGRPIDVKVIAREMPIALIAPFIPGVRLQRGTADLDFTIGGTLPDAEYHGSVQANNIWATIDANNVLYRLNGRATFKDNVLGIDKMFVQNDPRELAESGAEITGKIVFDGFSPDELDLRLVARRLLVLSEASETVDLGVYGDVVIRTGLRPLELTGTLLSPRLVGDVVILSGDLRIPDTESRLAGDEVVTFIDYDDWMALTQTSYGPELPPAMPRSADSAVPGGAGHIDSTLKSGGSLTQAALDMRQFLDSARARSAAPDPSFADALSADLELSMDQPMLIRMDMGPFEQLRLYVRQVGRSAKFTMRPGQAAMLWGNFSIEQGSEYTYIKRFEATGEVKFLGDVSNPSFAVNAHYDGRRYSENGSSQEFQVTVAIQGTSDKLKRPEFNYTIAGQTSAADPETRFRNAISLLLFSRTAEELRATGVGSHVQALASSALSSGGSTVASSALSDAFAGSFVRSFDIEFGDNIDRTRLNFVSQFGKIVFRYGGEVANPSQGLASLEIPVSEIFNAESLRNQVLQFQREVQSTEGILRSGGSTSQTETWRIRYQFRITW